MESELEQSSSHSQKIKDTWRKSVARGLSRMTKERAFDRGKKGAI